MQKRLSISLSVGNDETLLATSEWQVIPLTS